MKSHPEQMPRQILHNVSLAHSSTRQKTTRSLFDSSKNDSLRVTVAACVEGWINKKIHLVPKHCLGTYTRENELPRGKPRGIFVMPVPKGSLWEMLLSGIHRIDSR